MPMEDKLLVDAWRYLAKISLPPTENVVHKFVLEHQGWQEQWFSVLLAVAFRS